MPQFQAYSLCFSMLRDFQKARTTEEARCFLLFGGGLVGEDGHMWWRRGGGRSREIAGEAGNGNVRL